MVSDGEGVCVVFGQSMACSRGMGDLKWPVQYQTQLAQRSQLQMEDIQPCIPPENKALLKIPNLDYVSISCPALHRCINEHKQVGMCSLRTSEEQQICFALRA